MGAAHRRLALIAVLMTVIAAGLAGCSAGPGDGSLPDKFLSDHIESLLSPELAASDVPAAAQGPVYLNVRRHGEDPASYWGGRGPWLDKP